MNKYKLKSAHGITPDQLRKQFYTTQDRRCAVCENELEFGHATVYDGPSGKVVCRKCKMLLNAIRSALGSQLDRAMALALGGDSDGNEDNKCTG